MGIRVRTNLSLKERLQVKLSNFRGVDFTSSPYQVSSIRATNSKNLINIEGVNQKRNGWKQLINLGHRIDGLFNFNLNNDEFILVYSNKKFYLINESDGNYTKTDITNSATSNSVDANKLKTSKIQLYVNNNKAYILGCGDYLVFAKYGNNYELRRVYNNEDTYVPTTTLSIDEDSVDDSNRSTFEGVNILSSFRKNQMLGVSEVFVESTDTNYLVDKIYYSLLGTTYTQLESGVDYVVGAPISTTVYERKENTWTVDTGAIDNNSDIEIVLDTIIDGVAVTQTITNQNNSYRYVQLISGTDYQIGDNITEKVYIMGLQDYIETSDTTYQDNKTYYKKYSNKDKLYYSTDTSFNKPIGSVDFSNGKIKLRTNTTPQIAGRDNITIKFSYTLEGYSERVANCNLSILFGAGGNTDRLFVSGNNNFKNYTFWSEASDYTYFNENDFDVLGGNSIAIVGFTRVSDSVLLAFKEENTQEATIFYITGKNISTEDDDGNAEYKTYFYKQAGTIGETIISPYATANLAGDILILSKNGVYGLELATNISTNERYSKERSRYINGKLCNLSNLQDANSIVYKNRYYLSIPDENEGGIVFIADARYTSTSEEDVNDTLNYEWWYWTNVDARVWLVINNELYFGTSTGLICKFDNEYADRMFQDTEAGDLSITYSTDKITYNNTLSSELQTNDGIKFSNANVYALLLDSSDFDSIGYEYISLVENTNWIAGQSITGNLYELNQENNEYTQTADTNYITEKTYYQRVGRWIYTSVEKISRLYDGINVYADNVTNTGLSINTQYTISNVDLGNCRFSLLDSSDNYVDVQATTFRLCKLVTGKNLLVESVDSVNSTFTVKEYHDSKKLDLVIYNLTTPSNLKARITFKKNICASWYTPILDFGTNVSSKTLLGLTIATEPADYGSINFGFETRQNNRNYIAKTSRGFSFEDLNFEEFSFDSGFANSFTIKIKERNFNFIMFRFISDNQHYCAVNSISAIYKINKLNKGVR